MTKITKIGLLGGTFNPIHLGHLRMAETAKSALNLNKILFIPSGTPPHKQKDGLIDFFKRFELIRESIKNIPYCEVSDFDNTKDKSYTLNLINRVQKKFPEAKIFFIIGEDNVLNLKTWYKYKELLEKVQIVVLSRNIHFKKRQEWEDLPYIDKLLFIEMKKIDISSTKIRNLLDKKQSIDHLVPKPIADFYREMNEKER